VTALRNLFACLVHESPESVVDLVRNLRCLDPESGILLYNGGPEPDLLRRRFTVSGPEPVVYPSPRRVAWGALHEFALDCMGFGETEVGFDALTIVDSDQLLLRGGYSAALEAFLACRPGVGMLGNAPGPQPPGTRVPAAATAWRERALWLPYCRRFPDGEAKFPHWTFWPATVFTASACRELVAAFAQDEDLRRLMAASSLWATEEIVLPTLVALLGYEIAASPFSYDHVRYGVQATQWELEAALDRPDVFWVHPVARRLDDPLRALVRASHRHYDTATPGGTEMPEPDDMPLLLTLPILERMRAVDGWLSDEEADLLIAGLARALQELPGEAAVVEIGSYCGRSTTVLGSVTRALAPARHVHAIDPHDGEIGSQDQGLLHTSPTLPTFQRNMAATGLTEIVRVHPARSYDVEWDAPVGFLLIDGLHDYANVSRDFWHFERWLVEGAYVAFHDYADYFPGVKAFVNELLVGGGYVRVQRASSMLLLRRQPAAMTGGRAAELAAAPAAAPSRARTSVLVSAVMPTFGRPALARHAAELFLRQELLSAELIVVDDGVDPVVDLPDDPRIRWLRLDRRHSIGAKRNLGCEAARGEVLANWDDDDWYAPSRLAVQSHRLRASGADVTGLDRLLYLDVGGRRAWRYAWPSSDRPWVHDATLVFTRDFWRRNPFSDVSHGIDCSFLWTPLHKHVLASPDERLYVGTIHGANTSRKNPVASEWQLHPVEDLEGLMGSDADFYRQALGGTLAGRG
jgi:Methyltransferase domain/Glycosyl transferase family 2